MSYDCAVLPGGAYSRTAPGSSAGIAAEILLSLKRPSRLRNKFLAFSFSTLLLLTYMIVRSHGYDVDYREYVAAIHHHSLSIISVIESSRWQDYADPVSRAHTTSKKPKFHLLISSNNFNFHTCKTVLSAAILNYPPPTLINYNSSTEKEENLEIQAVRGVYTYITSRNAHDDDLALIIDEDTWLQLPAEVLIERYVQHSIDSDKSLMDKYGMIKNDTDSSEGASQSASKLVFQPQKYNEKVIFGAEKVCLDHEYGDLACTMVPPSSLAADIYGSQTDQTDIHTRPRYLDSRMHIGRVRDLRLIYQAAIEKLDLSVSLSSRQWAFSQIFGEQEAQREEEYQQIMSKKPPRWYSWLQSPFRPSSSDNAGTVHEHFIPNRERRYEFGIGLDYEASVFQSVQNSVNDLQFITFDHPVYIPSLSKTVSAAFQWPLKMPMDLNTTRGPFLQHQEPIEPINGDIRRPHTLDYLPPNLHWTDVGLATNVVIPGSQVPASLTFRGNKSEVGDFWARMWYQPHARALLRRYLRSPQGSTAALAAAEGGERWWDLRGGRGGLWTDKGLWLEWNEACGSFSNDVFLDDLGEIGKETEEDRLPVYNQFGKLIAGFGPAERPMSKEEKDEEKEKKDREKQDQVQEKTKEDKLRQIQKADEEKAAKAKESSGQPDRAARGNEQDNGKTPMTVEKEYEVEPYEKEGHRNDTLAERGVKLESSKQTSLPDTDEMIHMEKDDRDLKSGQARKLHRDERKESGLKKDGKDNADDSKA